MATRGNEMTRRGGSITRFDPWSELQAMQRSMDDLFHTYLGGSPARLFGGTNGGRWGWEPNVDLYETPDELVFSADLPGYSREDISISVTPDTLSINAQHTDSPVNGANGMMKAVEAGDPNGQTSEAVASPESPTNGNGSAIASNSTAVQTAQPQQPRTYHLQGQRRQSFAVSYTLPAEVDPDQTQASYKDGVLSVRMPKPERAKPKQVSVNIEG